MPAPLLLWSPGDVLAALSRAPHCEVGAPSRRGSGWDGCHCRDVLCCLLAQTCARWTSSQRWCPPVGWPMA